MSMYGIDPHDTADTLEAHAEWDAANLMRQMADRISHLENRLSGQNDANAHPEGADRPEPNQLEASARRALDALAALILNHPAPGTEAHAAQYELRQALAARAKDLEALRVWQIEAQRRNGTWTQWSATHLDGSEARADYEESITTAGKTQAFRLVSTLTTHTVDAIHIPDSQQEAAAASEETGA